MVQLSLARNWGILSMVMQNIIAYTTIISVSILMCAGSIPYLQSHFSHRLSSVPVYIGNVSCTGSEDKLQSCSQLSSNQMCPRNQDGYAYCFNG